MLNPLGSEGKCCPFGHEGYVDEYFMGNGIRYTFDFVKNPQVKE
jgi:hypothetical protein